MGSEPGGVQDRGGAESQKLEFQPAAHLDKRHGSGIEEENIPEENQRLVLARAEQDRCEIAADEAQGSDGRRIVVQSQDARERRGESHQCESSALRQQMIKGEGRVERKIKNRDAESTDRLCVCLMPGAPDALA